METAVIHSKDLIQSIKAWSPSEHGQFQPSMVAGWDTMAGFLPIHTGTGCPRDSLCPAWEEHHSYCREMLDNAVPGSELNRGQVG